MNETEIVEAVVKHLAGKHDQSKHGKGHVSTKDRLKKMAPYIAASGVGLGMLALAAAGKHAEIRDKEDEAVQGFKNDIDATLDAARHIRQQGELATHPENRKALLDSANTMEFEYHVMKPMKDWPREKILSYLYAKYGKGKI